MKSKWAVSLSKSAKLLDKENVFLPQRIVERTVESIYHVIDDKAFIFHCMHDIIELTDAILELKH